MEKQATFPTLQTPNYFDFGNGKSAYLTVFVGNKNVDSTNLCLRHSPTPSMSLWLTVKYRFTLRSGQPDAPLFTTLVLAMAVAAVVILLPVPPIPSYNLNNGKTSAPF